MLKITNAINIINSNIHNKEIVMNICLYCKKETLNPKFCNNSCSASYNNKKRKRTQESKTKISKIMKQYSIDNPEKYKNNKISKICYITFCKICNKVIRNTKTKKTCSSDCLHKYLSKVQKDNKRTHVGNKISITYNGVKLGSSYELIVAKELDINNIKWIKPKYIPYIDNKGTQRKYYPDFYLVEYDIYLDPKNDFLINNKNPYHGFSDIEKINWVKTQNNVKIIILDKYNLQWNNILYLLNNYSSCANLH